MIQRDINENSRLDPDVKVTCERVAVVVCASRDIVTAGIALVNVMLSDGSPDHGRSAGHKAPEDPLERREPYANSGEEGIELTIPSTLRVAVRILKNVNLRRDRRWV